MRISCRRVPLLYTMVALMLTATRPSVSFGQSADNRSRSAVVRPGPTPGIRFASGLTVCDEELYKGHWVNRYWTSTGQIKPENQMERREDDAAPPKDGDAFQLAI